MPKQTNRRQTRWSSLIGLIRAIVQPADIIVDMFRIAKGVRIPEVFAMTRESYHFWDEVIENTMACGVENLDHLKVRHRKMSVEHAYFICRYQTIRVRSASIVTIVSTVVFFIFWLRLLVNSADSARFLTASAIVFSVGSVSIFYYLVPARFTVLRIFVLCAMNFGSGVALALHSGEDFRLLDQPKGLTAYVALLFLLSGAFLLVLAIAVFAAFNVTFWWNEKRVPIAPAKSG